MRDISAIRRKREIIAEFARASESRAENRHSPQTAPMSSLK